MDRERRGVLGRRQRLVISMMFDQGYWMPGVPWGIGTETETRRVCQSLRQRGLLAWESGRERWVLAGAGYAWLFTDAARNLNRLSPDSDAWEQVLERIRHLAESARLARYGPVNWRGERV